MMPATLLLAVVLLLTANNGLSQSVESLPGFPGKLPLKLETGYVGVGDTVQLFYYFFESENNPETDPLLLWLTGGPGCSGFSGLVYEVGPLAFDYQNSSTGKGNQKLKLNPYSWTKVANMIFIDAPVGTGFSYATNADAYNMNDSMSAAQTYEFLQKWFQSHPQFLKNPLYIAGDSYAGIVLPIIVLKITEGIEAGHKPSMNLKGYILGNPVTDEHIDKNWQTPYAHKAGLIPESLYKDLERTCKGKYVNVDESNGPCLENLQTFEECTNMVNAGQILEPNCWHYRSKSKGSPHPDEHPRQWCREDNYVFSYAWNNDKDVRNAIHVHEGMIEHWWRCNETMSYTKDVVTSVPYHKALIKNDFQVLIYSGDLDMKVPYIGTMAWIKTLNLTLQRHWEPWYVDEQVAGYTFGYKHENYNFQYATVKGAGHTAPEYKPKECFAMFTRWLSGSPI